MTHQGSRGRDAEGRHRVDQGRRIGHRPARRLRRPVHRGIGGQRLHQDVAGLAGTAEPGDRFGADVATSLVQRDDRASIVIGAPGETVGANIRSGQFHQLSATDSGPSTTGSRTLHLDSSGVKGVPGRNKPPRSRTGLTPRPRLGNPVRATDPPRADLRPADLLSAARAGPYGVPGETWSSEVIDHLEEETDMITYLAGA